MSKTKLSEKDSDFCQCEWNLEQQRRGTFDLTGQDVRPNPIKGFGLMQGGMLFTQKDKNGVERIIAETVYPFRCWICNKCGKPIKWS